MPSLNPIQQLNVGEALGGASGAGVVQTDANGLILDPTTVALSSLANLADQGVMGRGADSAGAVELLSPSANGQLLKRTGGVVGFSALDLTDFAPALAFNQTWTGLQQFEDGLVLAPTTDPASPTPGQIWFRSSDGAVMLRESGGANMPLRQTGTWTPNLQPDTSGDFSASYTTQLGNYLKIGRFVWVWLRIATSAMTWSTASGTMRITGLPFAAATAPGQSSPGLMQTLFGLSLATTAGIMEPKLTISGAGATTAVFRQTVRGSTTTTGTNALNGTSGFLSGQNVTIEGGFWYTTNEA